MSDFPRRCGFALAAALIFAASTSAFCAGPQSKLDETAAAVAKKWPDLHHVTPATVDSLLKKDPSSVVLFDVRSEKEYAVSRLPGAIRVDPNATREAFIAAHASALKDKTAVFYCGVGVRSSTLESRIGAEALRNAGAVGSLNMSGGIYAWQGEGLPIVDSNGPAKTVEGYDPSWGKLSQ